MASGRSYKPKGVCLCVLFPSLPRIMRFMGSDPNCVTLGKHIPSKRFHFPLCNKGTRTVLSSLRGLNDTMDVMRLAWPHGQGQPHACLTQALPAKSLQGGGRGWWSLEQDPCQGQIQAGADAAPHVSPMHPMSLPCLSPLSLKIYSCELQASSLTPLPGQGLSLTISDSFIRVQSEWKVRKSFV